MAVADGATVVVGGATIDEGAFDEPTLVTNVIHGSTINQTEIFGRVTAIVRYDDVEQAVRRTQGAHVPFHKGVPGDG